MKKVQQETVYLDGGGFKIGQATLRRVNKNLCYLCAVSIYPTYRGRGFYKPLRKLAKERAMKLGYLGWIFTVRPDNESHYRRICKRFGPPVNEPMLDKHTAGLWWESFVDEAQPLVYTSENTQTA